LYRMHGLDDVKRGDFSKKSMLEIGMED